MKHRFGNYMKSVLNEMQQIVVKKAGWRSTTRVAALCILPEREVHPFRYLL